MLICYIDESGTPDIPGNTSHYVLAGLSIPIENWKDCDVCIQKIKMRYDLDDAEIHVGWMLRSYPEQRKISSFEKLSYSQRKAKMISYRNSELLRLQRANNPSQYQQTKKNFRKTEQYIHLTYNERMTLIKDVANALAGWNFARLFAECINKISFNSSRGQTVDEQAFEQVVSRFEQYLQLAHRDTNRFGLLIHDNNETVAKKHTLLMKQYHISGTFWTKLKHIIETPLFVSSELTSMVQLADVCAYALRRYVENGEDTLFDLIFKRADRIGGTTVGVRHYDKISCNCKICVAHKKPIPPGLSAAIPT